MENRLAVEPEVSKKLLRWLIGRGRGEDAVRTWANQKEVEKEIASYLEPWQQLLPKKMFDAIGPVAQGIATRTYSLPTQSNLMIDRSWNKW